MNIRVSFGREAVLIIFLKLRALGAMFTHVKYSDAIEAERRHESKAFAVF